MAYQYSLAQCALPSWSSHPWWAASVWPLPGTTWTNDYLSAADTPVYAVSPLATDTEVTGLVSVTLSVRSSAPDADWAAKLVTRRR
jgi:predicted acyl esterase